MKNLIFIAFTFFFSLKMFGQDKPKKMDNSKYFSFDTIINNPEGFVRSFSYIYGDSLSNFSDSTTTEFNLNDFFNQMDSLNPFSGFGDFFNQKESLDGIGNIDQMLNQFQQLFQGFYFNGDTFDDFMGEPEPKLKEKPKEDLKKKQDNTKPLKTISI